MSNLEENTPLENNESLSRESLIQNNTSKKKGIFGFILMGLTAIVLLFIFNGKEKEKVGIQKETIEFEPATKRPVSILETPPLPPIPTGPSEEDLAKLQKEEALKEARLKSAILVYGNHEGVANTNMSTANNDPSLVSSSTDPNARFQEAQASKTTPTAKASTLGNLASTILQGKLIDAVLETAIHSDLPGMLRAIVSEDIYAEAGENILIPKGSRLVGQYNSEVVKGQSRIFVIWNRVIRPDGIEVALNSGGTDPLGRAGLSGKVNNHFWKIFGNSLLLSIIGAGASTAGVDTADPSNSIAAYREQAQSAFQSSASRILEQSINIAPTITVKQGSLVKVLVAQDLNFAEALSKYSVNRVIQP